MATVDLDRIRQERQHRSLRTVCVLRLFVVLVLAFAVEVGVENHWRGQVALIVCYGAAAVAIAVSGLATSWHNDTVRRLQFWFPIADAAAIFGFKLLSPPGAYVPLLIMTVLPLTVVFDVSRRRAAVVLVVTAAAFAAAVFGDPLLIPQHGYGRMTLVVLVYTLLCATALLAVRVHTRHVDEIAALTVSREELLRESMASVDEQQRTISEFLHDGPLQSVLAARLDLQGFVRTSPNERVERALGGLNHAAKQLREATFELHPAVLEQAGVAAAIAQLTSSLSDRSGIVITHAVDYPHGTASDALLFGVIRELLSNVVRHSGATEAGVALRVVDGTAHLEVSDDGVGITADAASQRLAEGHIGLASHRARIEASGGSFTIVPDSRGTRIRVTLPVSYVNEGVR